ncbi:class I SAM-dependent methyltransferase [Phenylobacterium ferrooxidans]|uniref:Class I SAM-dependent methyltransferase n=1 Tax=Phenylobacterium ferrooxidans TaxID=2982689 RepID=A0ABW6CNK8_9CAUL
MSSFYSRKILPGLLTCACSSPPMMKQRAKIVPRASGRVLELGIGMGLNLAFYNPAAVTTVVGVDPSPELLALAEAAPRAPGLAVEVAEGTAEALPFEDGSFDTVVCTFTLCSVHTPAAALTEARRVLKPGGEFLFCEHGLAPDADVARWQRFWDPLWSRMAGGCHIIRPVAAALPAAGLKVDWLETMYLPGTPRIAGWNEWGRAVAA